MRHTVKEAVGAGPIMLGDIADELAGVKEKFSRFFPIIQRTFENPYVDGYLNKIMKNITSIIRECRAGTASMEPGGPTHKMFTETILSISELMQFVQNEEPNMVVLVQIFSESLGLLQDLANIITSRVGIAQTRASGFVDYAMFADLVELLIQLDDITTSDRRYSGSVPPGSFRQMAMQLANAVSDGITVDQVDRMLLNIANKLVSFEPVEPYGSGLLAGANDQIHRIANDLQLPQEEMHRKMFPTLPRVRSPIPTDTDDFHE